jgi:two-component system, chemotaxis family, protein-glutamate methylesterase/glutaminase
MAPAPLSARRPVEAVVIGGSAGAVAALGKLLPGLPASFPPVLVVVHVPPSPLSRLAGIFAPDCAMRVREPEAFEPIERGCIYFAPADYHLLVGRDLRCALSIEPPVNFSRPSIDVLFESAAHVYGASVVGIVLTGGSSDGAQGLRAICAVGGTGIIEDPETAEVAAMPIAARAAVPAARVLRLSAILAEVRSLEQAP